MGWTDPQKELTCRECNAKRGRDIIKVWAYSEDVPDLGDLNLGNFETVCSVCKEDLRVTQYRVFLDRYTFSSSVKIVALNPE